MTLSPDNFYFLPNTNGCPDCGDWGAIRFGLNGKSWTLDNMVDGIPEEIQEFVRDIKNLLEQLSN